MENGHPTSDQEKRKQLKKQRSIAQRYSYSCAFIVQNVIICGIIIFSFGRK